MAVFGPLGLLLGPLPLVQSCPQQFPSLLPILRLALRVLHPHLDAGWLMDEMHGGRDLIDVLPAGSGGGGDHLLDIAWVEVDLHFPGLRQHGHGGGRCMDSTLRFGCGHPLDLVCAALVSQA